MLLSFHKKRPICNALRSFLSHAGKLEKVEPPSEGKGKGVVEHPMNGFSTPVPALRALPLPSSKVRFTYCKAQKLQPNAVGAVSMVA